MQIRRAEVADEEELASIRRRAILALAVPAMSREQAESWATRGAADRVARAMREHDVWVAVEGAAIGWVEVDRDRVAALYVSPSCSRRGVGSVLLTFAETSIRTSGYTTARLESSQNALDYYLRRGYVRCGPADAHGAWPLRKDLASQIPPGADNEARRIMAPGATFRSHRVFPYQPESVFEAFARPELLARWWGPNGFTNTFEVFEFRPGGRWKFVMHGPDGSHHRNESVLLELHVPSKLVIHHVSPPRFLLTVTVAAHEAGTAITWAQEFEDTAVAARIRHIVEPANEQNLDRLLSVLVRGQR